MKILFLPNWKVHHIDSDTHGLQTPDKYVLAQPYWFFKYFPERAEVDIIDIQEHNVLYPLEKKIKFYIMQSIMAFFSKKHYDVIISHGAQSGLMLSLLRTLTFRRSPLHIIFDIGGMNGGRSNIIENGLIKFALISKPNIICHSRIIIENYKSTYKKLIDSALFIPFCVDTDYFSPLVEIEEQESYILSFGYAKRDYNTLLKAWEGISTSVKLRIIGLPEKDWLQIPNVEFLGNVSINELKIQIQKSLFVVIPLPVYNYSYGQMSFLQSMSMGKTVIVTITPSSIDYLKDGNGSFLVQPYNILDLRSKIELLLNDKDILIKNNQLARRYVLDNFSEKNMGLQLYDYIISLFMKDTKIRYHENSPYK